MHFCRYRGSLDHPLVSLQSSAPLDTHPLENLRSIGGPLLIKPSAAIVAGEAVENFDDTKNSIKALEKSIWQIPSYILILNDRSKMTENLINSIQSLQTEVVWILAEENDPIFTIICPNSSVVRKMHWRQTDFSDWKNFKGFCTENKKHLRIGYNPGLPFIHTDFSIASIEGIFLKTFIEKYELSHEWNDAGNSWGPFDKETGRFGGVVGLVGLCS